MAASKRPSLAVCGSAAAHAQHNCTRMHPNRRPAAHRRLLGSIRQLTRRPARPAQASGAVCPLGRAIWQICIGRRGPLHNRRSGRYLHAPLAILDRPSRAALTDWEELLKHGTACAGRRFPFRRSWPVCPQYQRSASEMRTAVAFRSGSHPPTHFLTATPALRGQLSSHASSSAAHCCQLSAQHTTAFGAAGARNLGRSLLLGAATRLC